MQEVLSPLTLVVPELLVVQACIYKVLLQQLGQSLHTLHTAIRER